MLLQAIGDALFTDALYSVQFEHGALDAAYKTAQTLVNTFSSYVIYILSILLTIEIARTSLLNERIDGMKMVNSLLILIVFINYNEVIGGLNDLMIDIFASLPQETTKTLVEKAPPQDFSLLSLFTTNFLTSNICMTLAFIIQAMVLYFRKVFILFLYAAGPIALMTSLIPSFGDGVLKNWFRNYISIHCWSLTIYILNSVFLFYVQNTQGGNDVSSSIYLAFAIMYLITPSLTNKYLGHAAANGLMGKMVGVITGAVIMSSKVLTSATKTLNNYKNKIPDLSGSMKNAGKNEHGAPQFESGKSGFRSAPPKPRSAEN